MCGLTTLNRVQSARLWPATIQYKAFSHSVSDNGSTGSRSGSRLHRLLAGSRLHRLLARVCSSSESSVARPSRLLAWTRSQLRRTHRSQDKKRTTSTPLLASQTDITGTEMEGTITATTVDPNFRLTTRLSEDQPLQLANKVNYVSIQKQRS